VSRVTTPDGGRQRPGRRPSAARDPDVRLYDAACELLASAQELRATAEQVDAAALAPALGCLQAGLAELELAVGALRAQPGTADRHPARRLRAALDDLEAMVRLAGRAADAARAAAAQATPCRSAPTA
jgi:hypothetical protein